MTEWQAGDPIFGNKLDGINYIDRPGAYALIVNDDQQIAVIETGNGFFLPGGGMDPGETELEALKRELQEETGYQVFVLSQAGTAFEYINGVREDQYYRIRSSFYKVQLGPKTMEGIEKDHRLVWLSREAAIKCLSRQSQVWAILNIEV